MQRFILVLVLSSAALALTLSCGESDGPTTPSSGEVSCEPRLQGVFEGGNCFGVDGLDPLKVLVFDDADAFSDALDCVNHGEIPVPRFNEQILVVAQWGHGQAACSEIRCVRKTSTVRIVSVSSGFVGSSRSTTVASWALVPRSSRPVSAVIEPSDCAPTFPGSCVDTSWGTFSPCTDWFTTRPIEDEAFVIRTDAEYDERFPGCDTDPASTLPPRPVAGEMLIVSTAFRGGCELCLSVRCVWQEEDGVLHAVVDEQGGGDCDALFHEGVWALAPDDGSPVVFDRGLPVCSER